MDLLITEWKGVSGFLSHGARVYVEPNAVNHAHSMRCTESSESLHKQLRRLFRAELTRQGWVDAQPTATGAADTPQSPASAALDNGQDKEKSMESVLTVEYRAKLRRNLSEHFKEELRTLCFDLGIEHENLPETKDGMGRFC